MEEDAKIAYLFKACEIVLGTLVEKIRICTGQFTKVGGTCLGRNEIAYERSL